MEEGKELVGTIAENRMQLINIKKEDSGALGYNFRAEFIVTDEVEDRELMDMLHRKQGDIPLGLVMNQEKIKGVWFNKLKGVTVYC